MCAAAFGFILGAFCVVRLTGAGRGRQLASRNAWTARKKYISRVERNENGEWRGEKESHFFHCRDRRHLRNFSLFILRLFSDAALRTNQRRKSGTKFIRRRHCLRAREKGPFPQLWLAGRRGARGMQGTRSEGRGNRRPNQSFRGKWKRCENRGYACMRVQSHPACRRRVSSASIDVVETRHSSREGEGGEFVQLSFLERSNDGRNMEEEERAANEGILPPNWTWQKELSNETRRRRERRKESCRSPARLSSAQLSSVQRNATTCCC